MNWTFFGVFNVLSILVTVGYIWPVSRRQFTIAFICYLAVSVVLALIVPADDTDTALWVTVFCFGSFAGVMFLLDQDARLPAVTLTGTGDGDTETVRRQND